MAVKVRHPDGGNGTQADDGPADGVSVAAIQSASRTVARRSTPVVTVILSLYARQNAPSAAV